MSEPWGRIDRDGDQRRVHMEHVYPCERDRLWGLVTDLQQLGRWFARVELLEGASAPPRVGTRYRIQFDDADPSDHTTGSILACAAPNSFTLSWTLPLEPLSQLRVELIPVPDGTRLVLDHYGLPRSQAVDYGAGWQAYLEQLAQVAGAQPPQPWLTPLNADWVARWRQLMPAYASGDKALPVDP